jgi:urease accessory protein
LIRLTRLLDTSAEPQATLTLPLESRVKSRLKVTLDDGREAGLFLPRGLQLRQGDLLADETGVVVQVRAAAEPVSSVDCTDALLLARACYHLGNRHVALQIEAHRVRYPEDPVLDAMLRGLGLEPRSESAPFEPEPGAYSPSPHRHHHGH